MSFHFRGTPRSLDKTILFDGPFSTGRNGPGFSPSNFLQELRMPKKFERCRLFSFLCFFPVFASYTRAQQTLDGITGIVMDVSGDWGRRLLG
jgi:hypothetical protein